LTRNYRNYTDADLILNATKVKSLAQLMRSVGLTPAGGNYIHMKHQIQKLNIDVSHFTGQLWSKDLQIKDYRNYTRSSNLKPHLIKERGHICELCQLSEWLDKPIMLEIHHIDGDRTNNNKPNLQLLCPNCHATTGNWRNRKRV